jgi:hypothetical protein
MAKHITYGIGGYCDPCDPELHGHPMNNLISEEEIPDPEPIPDNQQIANALAQLPQETLNALKQALGL